MGKHETLTGAQRVAKRRAALRAQGLRPRQFWLPDTRDPKVREGIRRSAEIINACDEEEDVMTWIESLRGEVWAGEPDYDWGADGPPQDVSGKG